MNESIKHASRLTLLAFAALGVSAANASTTIWSENFDDVGGLQLPVDEKGRAGGIYDAQNVWTTAPTSGLDGWTFDSSGVPGNGAAEWKGWSIANYAFWRDVAGDQTRSQFTKASGNVAVADPDEYDDYRGGISQDGSNLTDYYDALMTTGAINISGFIGSSLKLSFDSSWRPEGFDDMDGLNNQTATIRVSYDGGSTWSELTSWDSDDPAFGGQKYKGDAQNESLMFNVNAPLNASSVMFEFGLTKAANDWWWAVDNLELTGEPVPEPATIVALGLGAAALLRRKRSK